MSLQSREGSDIDAAVDSEPFYFVNEDGIFCLEAARVKSTSTLPFSLFAFMDFFVLEINEDNFSKHIYSR